MPAGIPLVQDWLADAAARLPDKVALVAAGQRLTYAELDGRSNALANALVARGVGRGDRVVVYADNTLEAAVAFWAVLKANAVVSMVSPLMKTDRLAHLLKDCGASALISDQHLERLFAPAVAQATHLKAVIVSGAPSWDEALAGDRAAAPANQTLDIDLGAIIYTSGSTGEPNGVMLTQRNMMTAATSICAYLENREDDVILGVLPFAFGYGLFQLIMSVRMGARLILERSFAFPAKVLSVMVEEKVTGFPGVPTLFATLAGLASIRSYDLSSLRYITNAAAALPRKHIDFLREVFPRARFYSMYGQTECNRISYLPPADLERKPDSVGIAIPNTEMWTVDEADNRLGPDQVGQLVIRGATVMRGYWGKPELTARKLRPGPLAGEVVLYTGDYCRIDAEGYLTFVSRMDDIIKSRGEKVAPKEVEHALTNVTGVRETAVIGVPDELLGQAIKAFVVLDPHVTLSEKDLQRECQKRLESFMVPKIIEIVAELPKTVTGKIKKTDLR
jgi:amino acid adenylation domain-containing protein